MLYLSRLLAGAGLGYTGEVGKAGELRSSVLLHLHTRVGKGSKALIVGIIKSSLPCNWSGIYTALILNIFCHLVQCWFKNGFTMYDLLKCVFAFLACTVKLMHLGTVSNIYNFIWNLWRRPIMYRCAVFCIFIFYAHFILQLRIALCVRSENRAAVYRCTYSLLRITIWLVEGHMLLFYPQNVNTCPVDRIKFNHIELLSCKNLNLIRKVWGMLITRLHVQLVAVHCSWSYLNASSHENVLHVCAK